MYCFDAVDSIRAVGFSLVPYLFNPFNFVDMTALDLKRDACASLWIKPCTFEELCVRLDKPEYGFWSIVKGAINDGWIYERSGVLYCYKKTAIKLNKTGDYELEFKSKPEESEFVKSLRKQGLI